MKILHISDTHNLHGELKHLPEADVIAFTGDMTVNGTQEEVDDFLSWFFALPYRYKLFTAGNRDDVLYEKEFDNLPEGCHFLYNSGVEIEGVRFYGVPMTYRDYVTGRQERFWNKIPDDIDVLLTHQPPRTILDGKGEHYGSDRLTTRLETLRPRLHLFGHCHAGYGAEERDGIWFYNSCLTDDDYKLTRRPHLITIDNKNRNRKMNRILLLSCHPDLGKSVANKALLEAASTVDGVRIMDIYKEEFTVDNYRAPFDECDVLLFQFPLYWGSAPARLKQWSDEIFFSLIDGGAGKGKKIMVAVTCGAKIEEFGPGGYNLYPISTLVSPYHLQANFSGMGWKPPFAVYGMEDSELSARRIPEGAERYKELLSSIVRGEE